jgi:lipid-A-disaccharide synthase
LGILAAENGHTCKDPGVRIFFSVGEPSGDLHGANLIRDLQALSPHVTCYGFGGPRMQAAGCDVRFDLTSLAVMWLGRVLAKLPTFFGLIAEAERTFHEERPDAVVLIDYPGFNWHIARKAKALGIPVIYYGVPQLWAWAPWRVKKMRETVDHALCKLPFEEAWFRERGVNATFVGHPYFDEMERQEYDSEFLVAQKRQQGQLVTILPGSRRQEVQGNLPPFLRAAKQIAAEVPDARFAVAAFNEPQADMARQLITQAGMNVPVHVGRTPELLAAATACLACSGSVSLELLWHERPSVVHYQTSPLLYLLGRCLMHVKYITLVNILADPQAFENVRREYDDTSPAADQVPFPEYPTWRDRSADMARHIVSWLQDDTLRQRKVAQLRELKRHVAQPGASRRAAQYLLEHLTLQTSGSAVKPKRAA